MAGTVKDITDALKGSISRELLTREGKRLAKRSKGNPSIPDDAKEGEPGTATGRAMTPADVTTEYERSEIAAAGKPIAGLDDDPDENPTVAHGVSTKEERDER